MSTTPPVVGPGRLLYNRVRRLRRAKRSMLLRRGVTVVHTEAKVLQFPTKEVTDGSHQDDQAGRVHE